MIKSNKFFVDYLKNIVFIGYSQVFSKLIEINNKLKINTCIISSTDQSKQINHKHIIFDKVDE